MKELEDVQGLSRTISAEESKRQGDKSRNGAASETVHIVTFDRTQEEKGTREEKEHEKIKEERGEYDKEENEEGRRELHLEGKEEEKGSGRREENKEGEETEYKNIHCPSDVILDAFDLRPNGTIMDQDRNALNGGITNESNEGKDVVCEKKIGVCEDIPHKEEESQPMTRTDGFKREQELACGREEAVDKEKVVGTSHVEDDKETNTSENKISSVTSKMSLWRTVLYSTIGSSVLLVSGTITGFTSVTLPQLTDPGSTDLTLEPAYAAIFASVLSLGAAVGGIVGLIIMVFIGQRKTLLLLLPCVFSLWMFISFTKSPLHLIIAKGILGSGIAISESAGNTFVAEFAHCNDRGRLLSVSIVIARVGECFVYILGSTGVTWRQIAIIIGIVTSIPTFVGLLFLHDSPRWLMRMERPLDAAKALQFFRGPKYNITEELEEIEYSIVESTSVLEQLKRFTDISILKRLFLFCFMDFLVAYSGSFTVRTYVVTMFRLANIPIDALYGAIILGVVKIFGGVAYGLVVDLVGRRLNVAVALLLCGLSMASFAVYFYIQDVLQESDLIATINWLPLVSLIIFTFFIGYGEPICFLLVHEVLPNSFRATGFSIVTVFYYLGGFSVSYAYPPMSEQFGIHGVFAFYTICCFVMAAIPYLFLPETKGRTLEDIEKSFRASVALTRDTFKYSDAEGRKMIASDEDTDEHLL